jgi:hypothetical protein
MKTWIKIFILYLILATSAFAYDYQLPINVKISNDGYWPVSIVSYAGVEYALSVYPVSMPSVTIIPNDTLPVKTTTSSSFTGNQVTVSNVATLVTALNTSRKSLIARNQGGTDMYCLNSGVTTANGLLVKVGEVLVLDRTTAALYCIVSSGTTTAGYLEE